MLIKCPECGKEISDKSKACIGCGYPLNNIPEQESKERPNKPHTVCPSCNEANNVGSYTCSSCGYKYRHDEYKIVWPGEKTIKKMDGIYKNTKANGLQKVYCPRCGSQDCSHYKEQLTIPGKTKTSYSINLNPLHPFTFFNKKEKIVRKEKVKTQDKIMCNVCGMTFK